MNLLRVLKISFLLLFFLSLTMIAPLLVSLLYDEPDTKAFLQSIAITSGISILVFFLNRKQSNELNHKEAFLIATLLWVLFAGFGALPYILSGSINSFTDAFFESMAGFSTTGSTIINDVESLSHGILFWRSLTQWLGGMGIIVLSVAILPLLGVGGMELFKTEVPGPVKDKMTPRVKDTAKALWVLYVCLTLSQALLLLLGGMPLFDAVCHSLTNTATGGFSTKNSSVEHFDSYFINIVMVVFMLIAGINFNLTYYALKGNLRQAFRNPELKIYLLIFLTATALITFNIYTEAGEHSAYGSIVNSLNQATFQVASIITTAGYSNTNWELWPSFSQYTLLLLFFVGGMAASTSGGIKVIRHLILWKHSYNQLNKIVHPHSVVSVKIDKKAIDRETLQSIWGFLFLYILVLCFSTLLLTFHNLDILTSFSAAASAIGNVGPGLNLVGPADNYNILPDTAKWILSACMLIGRLEIYTVLVLFVPQFWQR